MVIFQVLFIVILVLEILIGLAVKYNYKGFQDKLVTMVAIMDIENYIRNEFPDKWVFQMVFMLILFVLCIC